MVRAITDRIAQVSEIRAATHWGVALAQLAGDNYHQALSDASEAVELIRTSRTWLQYEAGMLSVVAAARLRLEDIVGAKSAAAEGAATAATRGARIQQAWCRWVWAAHCYGSIPMSPGLSSNTPASLPARTGP